MVLIQMILGAILLPGFIKSITIFEIIVSDSVVTRSDVDHSLNTFIVYGTLQNIVCICMCMHTCNDATNSGKVLRCRYM